MEQSLTAEWSIMGCGQYCTCGWYEIFLMFVNWGRMACVVGYLRHYYRWNGKPGLTLEEQRRLICEIARERKYGRGVGRLFLEEGVDGEETRWPELRKAIRMADDNADRDLLVVIPTLDGVQFNLSFLQVLSGGGGAPLFVPSCLGRPQKSQDHTTNDYPPTY